MANATGPAPDAVRVKLTGLSSGCLVLCLIFIAAAAGSLARTALTADTTSEQVFVWACVAVVLAGALWFLIRLPAMRRGAAVAFDQQGIWWTDGDAAYAGGIPWADVAAVGVGTYRDPRSTASSRLDQWLEVYLTDPDPRPVPELSHLFFEVVSPMPFLGGYCYRFQLLPSGAAQAAEQAAARWNPQLWRGSWEHLHRPRSARR
ncbi:hypothetical protein GCM10027589_52680 [Actinocorallia lasiicapitis]